MILAKTPSEIQRYVSVRETELGLGVFAREFIDIGNTIAIVQGQLIYDPNYHSEYCIEMGPEESLDPDPPFRYLNHSCDPNCWIYSNYEDDEDFIEEDELGLYVCRTIYPGEEITIDYGWPASSAIPCRCGSDCCRGWIVNPEELPTVLAANERERQKDWIVIDQPIASGNPNPEIILL